MSRAGPEDQDGSWLFKKAEAKALFLKGYAPGYIGKELEIPNVSIISQWAKNEGWDIEREEVLRKTTLDRLKELEKEQDEHIAGLKTIMDKSIGSIKDNSVVPSKFSEAASSFLASLDQYRRIKMESLQISFISDVAQILREEIQDKELLFRIAERFRKLFAKYQSAKSGGTDAEENP